MLFSLMIYLDKYFLKYGKLPAKALPGRAVILIKLLVIHLFAGKQHPKIELKFIFTNKHTT